MKQRRPPTDAAAKAAAGKDNAPSKSYRHIPVLIGTTRKAKRNGAASSREVSAGAKPALKKLRRQPNWTVWQGRPTVSMFSAICLIHNITPGHTYVEELRDAGDARCRHFDGHLITLKRWQPLDERLQAVPPSDAKPTDQTLVRLDYFIEFVRERKPFGGVTIPDEFWALKPPLVSASAIADPSGQQDTAAHADRRTDAATPHSPVPLPPQSPVAPVEPTVANAQPLVPSSVPNSVPNPSTRKSKPPRHAATRAIDLDQPGFLSLRDVLAIFPVSRSSWYAGMAKGIYPKPVPLVAGGRKVGWSTAEIKKLVEGLNA